MKAVVQRVSRASVRVDDEEVGAIGAGLLVLVAAEAGDTAIEADALASKVSGLRIFADQAGKMNRSVVDVEGGVLVVSQFTLAADVSRGRRPSFTPAADPESAAQLVDRLARALRHAGLFVAEGRFGAKMEVGLVNDGPVTFIIEVVDGRVA